METHNCLANIRSTTQNILFSVAPPIAGKTPNFSIFSGKTAQKRGSFEQWVFLGENCIKSHSETTLSEGTVHSLWGAVVNLVWYVGLHAPVFQMIEKLKLMYGTIASFNILMQIFLRLQQARTGGVQLL